MAFKRRKLSTKQAKRTFKRGARVHKMNVRKSPSRGGIRL